MIQSQQHARDREMATRTRVLLEQAGAPVPITFAFTGGQRT
jgi:hypothetical protein